MQILNSDPRKKYLKFLAYLEANQLNSCQLNERIAINNNNDLINLIRQKKLVAIFEEFDKSTKNLNIFVNSYYSFWKKRNILAFKDDKNQLNQAQNELSQIVQFTLQKFIYQEVKLVQYLFNYNKANFNIFKNEPLIQQQFGGFFSYVEDGQYQISKQQSVK